jgi:mannonate dehydratase
MNFALPPALQVSPHLLMEESFRWYGPNDQVPLSFIRQAGATAVFNALHEIPYGDLWPREAIHARKELLAQAGLHWTAVESVPVHEDIRTGTGDLDTLFQNYAQTLRNLAAEDVRVVIYNFMPVLDWVRTDLRHVLPDGSECLQFNPVHFAAFEVHALQRKGAENDYTPAQLAAAQAYWESLDTARREAFISGLIDVFPGCKLGLTLDDLRAMLAKYDGIDRDRLKANYARFLKAIVPVAEEVGVRLAVHPDDPPFSILGLARIVSTAEDVEEVFNMVDSPANGLCL